GWAALREEQPYSSAISARLGARPAASSRRRKSSTAARWGGREEGSLRLMVYICTPSASQGSRVTPLRPRSTATASPPLEALCGPDKTAPSAIQVRRSWAVAPALALPTCDALLFCAASGALPGWKCPSRSRVARIRPKAASGAPPRWEYPLRSPAVTPTRGDAPAA